MPATDEIYEKYLQKAIVEINDLAHEVAQAGGGTRVPVVGSGHPLADVMLLKFRPQPAEVQEGVAFYGRSGQAILKSLQRLHVDPMSVYGTNCLKFADGDENESRPFLTRELHIVQPKLIVAMGEGRRGVPQLDRVPAGGYRGVQAGRAPALHRNGPGLGCPRHRRVARRSSREDSVLERIQATRPMVGRAAALLVLGTALALYYAFHEKLWNASTWWDIAFIALVLIPACFALVWLVLPLRNMPGLLGVGLAFGVLAFLFHVAGWNTPENFCKLFGVTAVGLLVPALLRER